MFPSRFHNGRGSLGPAPGAPMAGAARTSRSGALPGLGLITLLVAVARPDGVSAQALGTMQVTARVIPGEPGWAAFSEASALARQVGSPSVSQSETRRVGLVQARAELASGQGRRRLLITIHYLHN
jgi:hypothetical protein